MGDAQRDAEGMKAWEDRINDGKYNPEEIFIVTPRGEVRRGPRWAPFEPDGYVYILVGGGFVKIGMSRNPEKRIRDFLGTKYPYRVEIAHLIPCEDYRRAEKTLHRKYAFHRTNGEWFTLSEGDLKDIKRIRAIRHGHIEYLGQRGHTA